MRSSNRRAMTILFLTMFIIMVGFGIILPILPFYAENMGASATHLGLLFGTYAIVQFIFAPMWGDVSDRMGRRPMLMMGLLGFGFSFLFFGMATSLWMLFAARILGGVLSAATLPTVMAYIADSTDSEQRGSGMGMMGAAMGTGMTFGPVIGGFLGELHPSVPFYFAAVLAAIVAVFVYILLPESLAAEAQKEARLRRGRHPGLLSGLAHGMLEVWQAAKGPVGFALILAFLASFASSNIIGTLALFVQAHLGYGEGEMGILFGVMGVMMAVTQGTVVGPFIKRWGEPRLIMWGLFGSGIGFLLLLVSYDLISLVCIMLVLGAGNATLRPAVNTLVSNRTPASHQGNMMGIVNSYNSLGRIFGPIAGGIIFDIAGYSWPYIIGATIFFVALLLAIVFFQRDTVNNARREHAARA